MKIYLHPLAHVQFIKKLRVMQRQSLKMVHQKEIWVGGGISQNRKLLHLAEHSYHQCLEVTVWECRGLGFNLALQVTCKFRLLLLGIPNYYWLY